MGTDDDQMTGVAQSGADADPMSDVALAILEAAICHLESVGASGLQVDQVLADAGASPEALEKHFGSRRDLVQAAIYERHHRLVEVESLSRLEMAESASTTAEFCTFMADQLTRIATDPTSQAARMARVRSAANSLDRPDLVDQFEARQHALLDVLAQVFERAKARGIINPDLDSYGYSAWFHGMNLGMTFTERTLHDSHRWLAVAIPAALAPLQMPAVDPGP